MAEYIEREAAIAETRKPRLTDAELRRRIANIPSADVVPVVRCGECMWSDNYGLELMCQKHSGITKSKLGEDIHFVEWHSKYFFCSDGERRDAK